MNINKQIRMMLWWNATVLIFGYSLSATACPIPIFQYSLEYFQTDPYEVEVQHDGEFTPEEQAVVDILKKAAASPETNIQLRWRDYSKAAVPPPDGMELPYVKVGYPTMSGIRGTFWEGELDKEVAEQLLHSSIRQKIAEKLLDRHSGVWILLKSGNAGKDRKALQILEEELPRLEKTLKVPEDPGGYFGDIQTEIKFSMITLDRDDPKEQIFIDMLLGIERDLRDYEDKPMVFPIYGRGLVMYALIGEGIDEWTLNSAGEFLTGPSTSQVKMGNPGVDILMSTDWESRVEPLTEYSGHGAAAGGFMDRMEEADERLSD